MSHYSFKQDILSHSFLHYFTQETPEQESSFLASILSVIVIILQMVQGNRILKQEANDIRIQKLDHEHYWYMLEDETQANEVVDECQSVVEQVLERESMFIVEVQSRLFV